MSKPIVIAGAGIIGCLLGMILKKRDIPFVILEKNKELKKIPFRTVALTKDTILSLLILWIKKSTLIDGPRL